MTETFPIVVAVRHHDPKHHAAIAARSTDRKLCGYWLDTFEFQAAGYYEKLGYSRFGMIEDHPICHSRLFFKKRLKPA
jgi:hypothetical protein